jgi:Rrf2 family iron-sulfur cluster assembly transcriptional regulator
MQITRAGEYAILGMLYLARQPANRHVMVEEISDAERIPKSFLAKIFQNLVKAGFVTSHRGAGGGFSLKRPASKITVLEILDCIEGPIHLQRCLEDAALCERKDNCPLCLLFREAQDHLTDVFSRTTLKDLMQPKEKLIRSQLRRSRN